MDPIQSVTGQSQQDIRDALETFRQQYRAMASEIGLLQREIEWVTPSRVVLDQGVMRLRRFEGEDAPDIGQPLLIVYSHVNKPSIIDLDNERSVVRALQRAGNAVYLLEWQEVKPADAGNDLSQYVDTAINTAVDWMRSRFEVNQINLMGVCQGGTFGVCYASLYPEKVARVACIVTPVDFHGGDSLLARWSRNIDFDALIERPANVPGKFITAMFQSMRPFDDMLRQIRLIGARDDKDASRAFSMRMDQWVYDCPDQPGRAFAQFAKQCFVDNALVKNQLVVGERPVDLGSLAMPVLNVYATEDHIVPAESAASLADFVKTSRYRNIEFDGGHIGLLVSSRSRGVVWPEVCEWLTQ